MKPQSMRISLTLAAAMATAGAHAADLFVQDFETDTAGVSGAGFVSGTGGYGALGYGSLMFRNAEFGNPAASTSISFDAASAADAGTLDFDLAVIDSWDGDSSRGGCCNTDLFTVTLDGQRVFQADFNNTWSFVPGFDGADTQIFPRDGRMLAGPVANLAGEWNGDSGYDAAYRLSVALGPLAAGTHTLEFFAGGPGWQGGEDESFAIDNLRVTATPVPLPAAWLLMASGAAALRLRRRKARLAA